MVARLRAWRPFLLFNLALLGFAAAVLAYLYLLRVVQLPLLCYTNRLFHLYCPGCGLSRATEALLRGEVLASLTAHPFALLAVALAAYYEIALALRACGRGRVSATPAVVFAFSLLAFALLRDLLLVFWGIDPLGDLIGYWSVHTW